MGRPIKDRVNRGNHSLNEDRSKNEKNMRTKSTVKRLKMYRNSKERRNAIGKVVKEAPFQSTVESGKMVRIEPNRKWFGNTRVIAEKDLLKLQEYETTYDPYQIMIRHSTLPISFNKINKKKNKPDLSNLQPYFKRKIPRKESNIKARTFEELSAQTKAGLEIFNAKEQLESENTDKSEATHGVFRAGTSNRIWMELYKVIDSSDVLLYVLDARNPMGMRSSKIENDIKNKRKTMIFVLNKVDLLPFGVTRYWEKKLSEEYPTVVFHADIKHPLGKYKLINLLRQIRDKMKDRRQISVGVIGFPNTGKSSLINTLRGEKVCKVAPIAGETKVWQYITLMKSINLIDCPGTVTGTEGSEKLSETDLILRNSVRVEKVTDADQHIPAVLKIVRPDVLSRHYKLTKPFDSSEQFLEMLAKARGRLLKGGQADILSVAKEVLKDFNCGKLLWYVKPDSYDNSKETVNDFNNQEWLKEQFILDEKEKNETPDEPVGDEDNEDANENEDCAKSDNESSDEEEIFEDIKEKKKSDKETEATENTNTQLKSKGKKKGKGKKNENSVKKLSCKERRTLERATRNKQTGVHYYKEVDSKMRRTKF